MSDSEPAVPAFPVQVDPMPGLDTSAPPATAGAAPLEPEEAEEAVAANVATCGTCGHAESAHTSGGRCLVQLGAYGTEGACRCPEVAA